MAIIWNGSGHTIRRGRGVASRETHIDLADFTRPGNDRAIEAQVQNVVRQRLRDKGRPGTVFVHITSRSPLGYTLRVAPPGHTPEPDWWSND